MPGLRRAKKLEGEMTAFVVRVLRSKKKMASKRMLFYAVIVPPSAVLEDAMPVDLGHLPAKAIMTIVWLAIVEPGDSPHLVKTGLLQQFLGVKCPIPLG